MEKKRLWVLAGVMVALFSLALLAAACDGDEEDENGNGDVPTATQPADSEPGDGVTVDVSHVEWAVNLSSDTVAAGTVTLNITNDGTITHNFRIAKTDLAPDALPMDNDTFTVNEDEVGVIDGTEDLDVGESAVLTVDLEPGAYVLFCNLPTHYEVGTYTGFTVE